MTRKLAAGITGALLFLLLAFDLATADLNPFNAPPAIALGSGVAGGGAFCGELPS